jgi:[lysine-biosynthesis-protein LysW]---L-2-aminoadipate ligase
MRFALITCRPTHTNDALASRSSRHAVWEQMTPNQALEALGPGDAALGRLDVLPTLDGMDDGLWALGALAARGVVVLNDPPALLAAHDKLLTARVLARHNVPHPPTAHIRGWGSVRAPGRPVVVKPRFGSWGKDVNRSDSQTDFEEALAAARDRDWYRRHGVLVQDLIRPQGYDLRIIVVAGRVVGAVYRVAAPGEWRTNIALGGVRRPVAEPPRSAAALAIDAATAAGIDLAGVDLLPDGRGGWVVVELNGAVEFTEEYASWGDIFSETAEILATHARDQLERRAVVAA